MNRRSEKLMRLQIWAILGCVFLWCGLGHGQSDPKGQKQPEQDLTFHTGSSLVLVDVFTLDPKTGLPLNTLKRDDFQVFDNGKPVPLATFDSGAHYDTRPVALWFVILCNMNDWGDLGSGLFLGKSALFRPALDHLDSHDS